MKYAVWVMMDSENEVITEEYTTSIEALYEMLDKGYTIKEMHENGFTLDKLATDGKTWIECLEEIDY